MTTRLRWGPVHWRKPYDGGRGWWLWGCGVVKRHHIELDRDRWYAVIGHLRIRLSR